MWLGRAYGEKADNSSWAAALPLARKVRSEFEKAVELNGGNVEARSDLAEFYVRAPYFLGGSREKAQMQADQLRAVGSEPASLWVQSIIAEADKNYDAAERDLRAAINAGHGSPETYLNLASFYRRRGRMTEMENLLQQAVQAATQARRFGLLLEAAQMLDQAGRDLNGALRLLRTYIAAPQHSEDAPVFQAHYLMGGILEKLGDKRGAAGQYHAALSLASEFAPAQSALKRVE
jgi:tetratricopeptide (TPR) repeat protein